jgi:hypothetical protein
MGGVDIADQLRSYYPTQLKCCRSWYPLFFWLLDTTIVNSFRLDCTLRPSNRIRSHHSIFREKLSSKLISTGIKELEELFCTTSERGSASSSISISHLDRTPYISKHSTAPSPIHFPAPSTHHLEGRPTRTLCLFCRWKRTSSSSVDHTKKVKSVNTGCQECAVTLCQPCFVEFHIVT